ncbi:MAG: hypothetical protein ACOC3Z_00835 [Nanoarchaeota archaeon]
MSENDKQTISFIAGKINYSIFFAKDNESVELYETENPRNGMVFGNYKQLFSFINFLTDIVEDKLGEE